MTDALTMVEPDKLLQIADLIGKSGLFKAKSAEEVATKILWGMEFGFGPVASVQMIDVIQGSPSMSGAAVAALIDRSPCYSYQILLRGLEHAEVAFYKGPGLAHSSPFLASWNPDENPWAGLKPGVSYSGSVVYTLEDAKAAGLAGKQNWRAHPRAMLSWRAITEGAKVYAPDLLGGSKAYTPDELGEPELPPEALQPPGEPTPLPVTQRITEEPLGVVEANFTATPEDEDDGTVYFLTPKGRAMQAASDASPEPDAALGMAMLAHGMRNAFEVPSNPANPDHPDRPQGQEPLF